MNVLFITNSNPFSCGGGNYASRAYLAALNTIFDGNIDIILDNSCNIEPLHQKNEYIQVPERTIIKKTIGLFSGEINRFNSFVTNYIKKSNKNKKYDLCVYSSSLVSNSINYVKSKGIKIITIHHNFEVDYFNSLKKNLRWWSIRLTGEIKKTEYNAYKKSDINLFISKNDMLKMRNMYGFANHNSVIGCFESRPVKSETGIFKFFDINEISIVVSGSLVDDQTQDAVKYFLKDILPTIQMNTHIIITGRDPNKEIIDLCSKNPSITLVANPKNIDEIIQKADIYVSTTRLGSGLKLRIMDGMRNGLPILTHIVSAQGYDEFEKYVWFKKFSTINEFNDGLNSLVKLLYEKKINKREIINSYKSHFSFEEGLKRVYNVINKTF
jgi:hypothetical protein